MKNINTIFVIDCEKLDDSNVYVISFGLDKKYDHRYEEWKAGNVYHDAYDKLLTFLSALASTLTSTTLASRLHH